MSNNKPRPGDRLVGFIIIGIGIAIIFALFMMLAYAVVWGIFIGAVLWCIAWLKDYFFPPKKPKKRHKGRVIEHDDS